MASTQLESLSLDTANRIEELPASDDDAGWRPVRSAPSYPPVPKLHLSKPALRDALETKSSEDQDEVVEASLRFLAGNPNNRPLNRKGIQKLQRQNHIDFLRYALEDYPAPFVAMDASRPWVFYWSLTGLSMLGVDVRAEYRDRLTNTLAAAQNTTGGFGGGHGQYAHVAGSYAGVLSLAIVGGEQSYDMVDRKTMWHFLGNMKQRDGGFTVAPGAEEDIRGAYCALTIVSLLNLPLELPPGSPARVKGDETFLTNLPGWILRCQSFEGGIGAAPGNEAHGAYAFCALACLSIIGEPYETIPNNLDISRLIGWLSSRQQAPEGGFAGRTNKLVDGCYSHWIGGCWSLIEAALQNSNKLDESLWSRNSLARWILCCCQAKRGLRDKPTKPPDSYHTCYNLAGLCATQYRYIYNNSKKDSFPGSRLTAGFKWEVENYGGRGVLDDEKTNTDDAWCWDEEDLLQPVHPVFVIPIGQAEKMRRHFEAKGGWNDSPGAFHGDLQSSLHDGHAKTLSDLFANKVSTVLFSEP